LKQQGTCRRRSSVVTYPASRTPIVKYAKPKTIPKRRKAEVNQHGRAVTGRATNHWGELDRQIHRRRGGDPSAAAPALPTQCALRGSERAREDRVGYLPEGARSKRKAKGTSREQRTSASTATRGPLRLLSAAGSSGCAFIASSSSSGSRRPRPLR